MDVNNGPPGLSPLDIRIIQGDIPNDRICLFELFKGISFGLTTILQSNILV